MLYGQDTNHPMLNYHNRHHAHSQPRRRSSLILTGSYLCSPEIGPSYHYYHKTLSSEAIVELPLAAFRGLRLFRRPEFFTSK
ncbi:hypothetical protein K443DRAFT_686238 [Laccaria amethystina LaAM-08-1]|uniref:Uncharacterized protein n=1 Tax=Laccaria amethystina LaAM-08-1 TaxID=1095629 RepID=A0A0C9X3T1_9AGAR|nr:hypothetical protein K443DRAFT_686238 [Laccaria amethystina LaAM-08-1]